MIDITLFSLNIPQASDFSLFEFDWSQLKVSEYRLISYRTLFVFHLCHVLVFEYHHTFYLWLLEYLDSLKM